MKKLNLLKMLEEIDGLVSNDFVANMEMRLIDQPSKYTRAESRKMSHLLAKVYSIAHCIHCEACSKKYLISN